MSEDTARGHDGTTATHESRPAASIPAESSRPADESDLVRRALQGEQAAFAQLIDGPCKAIHAYIRRMTGDEVIAEDLRQEVLLKAYQRLSGFLGKSSFSTWLFRIAVNHTRDYLHSRVARARRREQSLDNRVGARELVSKTPLPDAHAAFNELEGVFAQCLQALETHLREAFVLRHQEGLSYDEMTKILKTSRANARIRVHRARERILGELRKRGYQV